MLNALKNSWTPFDASVTDISAGGMAMTADVKDELSRLAVARTCCRKAEVCALLRFGGGLHIVGGKIVVEAEFDSVKVFSLPSVGDGTRRRHIELGVKGEPNAVEKAYARMLTGLDNLRQEYVAVAT